MAGARSKVTFGDIKTTITATGNTRGRTGASVPQKDLQSAHLLGLFPCVVYECTSSFEIVFVSPNASELININGSELIGTRGFWCERVFPEDVDSLVEHSHDLKISGAVSFLHRLMDDCGLPVWVAHSLRKVGAEQEAHLRGCLIPIRGDKRVQELDHNAISRFIHKLGNHFQLITLLMNPLKKMLPPNCREAEILEQTIEKSIDLTRAFSEYKQWPNGISEIDVWELLNAMVGPRESLFIDAGIAFHVSIEGALRGVMILGDAGLLESAIGNVLQNALEATQPQGQVRVEATLEKSAVNGARVAVLRVADTGCGIRRQDMDKVRTAFYTTRKNRDGLGLSMATRFIGLHGGSCRIDSCEGKGTEFTITLPVAPGSY